MGRAKTTAGAAQACLLVLLAIVSTASANLQSERHSRWERVLQGGASAMMSAKAPAAALGLPAQGLGTPAFAPAFAPAPAPSYGPPAAPKASDSLALTNSTVDQLQTLGTYQSDHVAPPGGILTLLNTSAYQNALGPNAAYAPSAFQFTLPDIFFQLDNLGIRQFHFNAWKDPNGTLAANPAGLKLAGITNETLDPKYTYFGYKTFNDPDFDYRSSCVTLETCLQLIQSWSVNHSNHIPITIYMEPKETTLFSGQGAASINQQLASAPGRPASLATPFPIGAADLVELQNTVYRVFNQTQIVLPGSLLGNATSLQAATQGPSGGNWPALDSVRGRFMFVLVDSTGKYGPMYRALFPGLRSATFFVSQPGGNATVDPSTVFLDFLGPLGAATTQAWTVDAENAAVATVSAQITAAVRKGFLTRAAADWQTVEPREGYTNRTMQAIRAGAQFVQTSFPDVSKLPKYAYSTKGTSNFTLFTTNYTATLPLRLGMTFTAGRCDPQTSAGIVVNETASGCGNPADNAALAPQTSASV